MFRFPYPLQDEFLYELSLADGVFLHPRNFKFDWSVTAGAYFRDSIVEDWKKWKIDVLRSHVDSKLPVKFFRKHAQKVWKRFPVFLHLFSFCFVKKVLSKAERKAFASLMYHAQVKQLDFQRDFQLILQGFSLSNVLYDLKAFQKAMLEAAKTNGFSVTFLKSPSPLKSFKKDFFAFPLGFKANQKDPMSIWSFLLRSSYGLKCFEKSLKPIFQKSLEAPSRSLKWFAFQKLHRKILEDAMMVPFGFEPIEYFTTTCVSLKKLNPLLSRKAHFFKHILNVTDFNIFLKVCFFF